MPCRHWAPTGERSRAPLRGRPPQARLNSIKWHRVVLDVSGNPENSDNTLYVMRKGMEA